MNHLDLATISTTVVAVIALLAAIGGGIRWFYKRGQQEQSLADSVNRAAAASEKAAESTDKLANQVEGLRETLESHAEKLTEHHWRIKALEDRTVEVRVH